MKKTVYLILVLLATSLTSCFDIIEDITLNENGTGKVKMIFNFSQSKSNINKLLMLKEVNGHEVPSIEKIVAKIDNIKDSINNINGISGVTTKINIENYITEFEFNFDKIERLNTVYYELWKMAHAPSVRFEKYFSYQNHIFTRKGGTFINLLNQRTQGADRNIFVGAKIISVLKLPNTVESFTNNKSKLAGNQKIVILQLPVSSLILNAKLLHNLIKIKNV